VTTDVPFSIETGFTLQTDYSDWRSGNQRILHGVAAVPQPNIRAAPAQRNRVRGKHIGDSSLWLVPLSCLGTPDRLPPRLVPPRISSSSSPSDGDFLFQPSPEFAASSHDQHARHAVGNIPPCSPEKPPVKSMIQKGLNRSAVKVTANR